MRDKIWLAGSSLSLALAVAGGLLLVAANGSVTPKIVKISAKRFEFKPGEIILKKGVPVVLQLTSEDRTHGFNISAMNLRTDIEPGKTAELKFTPEKTGDYDFFCDVFCGSGHEGMGGKLKVVD